MPDTKKDIINQLQKNILAWQGFKTPVAGAHELVGLGPVEAAFPNGIFPIGAIHEFLNEVPEHAAASGSFITGILASLMQQGRPCLWLGVSRMLFPPSLKAF